MKNKFYISDSIGSSTVYPLLIKQNEIFYCLSNNQRKDNNEVNYIEIGGLRKFNINKYNYSTISGVYDNNTFDKKYPHFSNNCKQLVNKYNREYELLSVLVERHSFYGYDKKFICTPETIHDVRQLWNCNWENTQGDIITSVSFMEYFYVYELVRDDIYATIVKKRYCKKLFSESKDMFLL